jgi:nucleoid-associated protein YgaU
VFDHTSRYYALETAKFTPPVGPPIAYVKRRFLPQGKDLPLLGEVFVEDNDRLDQISARTLGNPEYFWRIADANDAMNPLDLTAHIGQVVRIPLPQV